MRRISTIFIFLMIGSIIYGQGYNEPEKELPPEYTDKPNPNNPIILDLAITAPGEYERSLSPRDRVPIEIHNRIMTGKFSYSVNIYVTNQAVESFNQENIIPDGIPDFMNNLVSSEDTINCDLLKQFNEEFDELSDESKLLKFRKRAKETLEIESYKRDTGCIELEKLSYNIQLSLSLFKDKIYQFKRGQILHIEVTRTGGGETKKWKWVYKAPSRGKWQTTYGFNHLSYLFSKKDNYFLETMDTMFLIKNGREGDWFEIRPTIMFSWLPSQRELKNLSYSFSGGLGIDFENPSILLGAGLTYNQNISVVLGISSHKQQKLLGRYEEDQLIEENLTTEQLHHDVYRINPFINISFRFDGNPFKMKEEEAASANDNVDEAASESVETTSVTGKS